MIRPYEAEDRANVERICLPNPSLNALYDEAILKCFCAYYIENTQNCCFVATDENDEAIGYVLCAPDFDKWERSFIKDYIERSDNPYLKAMGKATIKALMPFAKEYSAHLHIDIDENYRGQKLGTKLIAALIQKLKELHVNGVMLDVANDNASAQKFYLRQGFTPLYKGENETVMGVKL